MLIYHYEYIFLYKLQRLSLKTCGHTLSMLFVVTYYCVAIP